MSIALGVLPRSCTVRFAWQGIPAWVYTLLRLTSARSASRLSRPTKALTPESCDVPALVPAMSTAMAPIWDRTLIHPADFDRVSIGLWEVAVANCFGDAGAVPRTFPSQEHIEPVSARVKPDARPARVQGARGGGGNPRRPDTTRRAAMHGPVLALAQQMLGGPSAPIEWSGRQGSRGPRKRECQRHTDGTIWQNPAGTATAPVIITMAIDVALPGAHPCSA